MLVSGIALLMSCRPRSPNLLDDPDDPEQLPWPYRHVVTSIVVSISASESFGELVVGDTGRASRRSCYPFFSSRSRNRSSARFLSSARPRPSPPVGRSSVLWNGARDRAGRAADRGGCGSGWHVARPTVVRLPGQRRAVRRYDPRPQPRSSWLTTRPVGPASVYIESSDPHGDA